MGIFGRVPDGSARAAGASAPGSGAVDPDLGHRFGPEEIDEFEEKLREAAEGGKKGFGGGPALVGGEKLGLRVTVAAEDDVEAYRTARELYVEAYSAAFGPSPDVDECEVLLQEKFEEREGRRLAEERVAAGGGEVELLGTGGAARVLGLKPQRVDQLERARAEGKRHDFPAPRARTDGRPGWLPEDVEAFGRRRRRNGQHVTSDSLPLPGLRRARLSRDWTQGFLAEESGVTQVTISNLEKGKGKGARRETRRKLARALEVPEEDLLLAPADEMTGARR
ncbi:MAG: helix-turn-helix domain-containing protein [Actinomycetota bacterium]|nr:helix-turn-helix domain-containing protein [Actinomycetota bacterium]